MKKIFATLFAVMFLFTGVAFADSYKDDPRGTHDNGNGWGGPPTNNNEGSNSHTGFGTVETGLNLYVGGGSQDSDIAVSNHWHGNDYAKSYAGSGGSMENEGYAKEKSIFGVAGNVGSITMEGKSDADAFAKDFGTTSIAGASALTDVHAFGGGTSFFGGLKGDGYAKNETEAKISGEVCQYNIAKEVGYHSGTFAVAQNASGASFEAFAKDYDKDYDSSSRRNPLFGGIAESGLCLYGKAYTAGGSIASVDATGYHQSAFGATGNISYVDVAGADCAKTNVWGVGEVAVGSFVERRDSAAGAGGIAGFSYTGKEFGMGGAVVNSNVNAGSNSFSATATGSSFATSK
jgi:hypothetical protein